MNFRNRTFYHGDKEESMEFEVEFEKESRRVVADKITRAESLVFFWNKRGEVVAVAREPMLIRRQDAIPTDGTRPSS